MEVNKTGFNDFLLKILNNENILKLIISNPENKNENIKKIIFTNKIDRYMACTYSAKQCFASNIKNTELVEKVLEDFDRYKQINIYTNLSEYNVNRSKKSKIFISGNKTTKNLKLDSNNNREKNYILKENVIIPPLIDMGVFTNDGKIVKPKYDKYKQINRFIEIINDAIKDKNLDKINIIDFGCGKSYLTFVVYYYFKFIKNIDVNIVGLDLKSEVIEKCNETARKYGYSNLHFEVGDINGYHPSMGVDMIISLHACDTATDLALYNALKWNVKMIFSVPCCQHEVNLQINSQGLPIITRYGLIKERISSDFTDIIRCNLLKAMNYNVDMIEFVGFEHTPKNILIRARKTEIPLQERKKYLNEVEDLMKFFGFNQKLYSLLKRELNF